MTTPDNTQSRDTTTAHDRQGDVPRAPTWQWLTVIEVARRIGLTEERVRQLIREKKIRATKIGGWLVRPDDLDAFIRSRTNIWERRDAAG